MHIGILHPGAMGASIAASLQASGHQVSWVATGRSPASIARARTLNELPDLQALVREVEAIVSVCPPGAALALAKAVAEAEFSGWYLDANAIAPVTALAVAQLFGEQYIDGGIIGPPAHKSGTTRLYVAGSNAEIAVNWFAPDSLLQAEAIPGANNAASALKMAYAAYTKGSSALLLAVNALAAAYQVEQPLYAEWARSQPGLHKRSEVTATATGPKAWRFADEMAEIATTFEAAGLPPEFHLGAQKLYEHLADLKDQEVDLEAVLAAIARATS